MAVNAKRKGNRQEHKTIKFYADQGYGTCRAAASKGVFDVIAWNRLTVLFIQVKSNRWPGSEEIETIRAEHVPPLAQKLVVRWDDNARLPTVREII